MTGLLLIIDEIQTGMGRTANFAYEHYGIEPDIFTLAKALAGGVPIGALCAKDSVAQAFEPGDHGSTFGGYPLACSAGLAVLKTMLDEDLPANAEKMGRNFMDELKKLSGKHGIISEIRGIGLMIGIQLAQDKAAAVKTKLFENGWLVGSVGASVIRLLPPLIITKEDIDAFAKALDEVLMSL